MRKSIALSVEVPPSREITIKVPDEVPVGPASLFLTIAPEHRHARNAKDRASIRAAIAEMKEFGKGRKLDGLSIREMIEEGREGG